MYTLTLNTVSWYTYSTLVLPFANPISYNYCYCFYLKAVFLFLSMFTILFAHFSSCISERPSYHFSSSQHTSFSCSYWMPVSGKISPFLFNLKIYLLYLHSWKIIFLHSKILGWQFLFLCHLLLRCQSLVMSFLCRWSVSCLSFSSFSSFGFCSFTTICIDMGLFFNPACASWVWGFLSLISS